MKHTKADLFRDCRLGRCGCLSVETASAQAAEMPRKWARDFPAGLGADCIWGGA